MYRLHKLHADFHKIAAKSQSYEFTVTLCVN